MVVQCLQGIGNKDAEFTEPWQNEGMDGVKSYLNYFKMERIIVNSIDLFKIIIAY